MLNMLLVIFRCFLTPINILLVRSGCISPQCFSSFVLEAVGPLKPFTRFGFNRSILRRTLLPCGNLAASVPGSPQLSCPRHSVRISFDNLFLIAVGLVTWYFFHSPPRCTQM